MRNHLHHLKFTGTFIVSDLDLIMVWWRTQNISKMVDSKVRWYEELDMDVCDTKHRR